MIGRHVQWRHKNTEGQPTRDLAGEVAAVQFSGREFLVLVECADGLMQTASATDLVFSSPAQPTSISTQGMNYQEAEKLIDIIRGLGLEDDTTIADPCGHAGRIIEEAMTELQTLSAEKDAALAELATLKAKKPGKKAKGAPMDEGGE